MKTWYRKIVTFWRNGNHQGNSGRVLWLLRRNCMQ